MLISRCHRDSKIARLLKDSVGNPTCRTTIINHVSPDEDRYTDTLATLEMASKISRSRRRKNKVFLDFSICFCLIFLIRSYFKPTRLVFLFCCFFLILQTGRVRTESLMEFIMTLMLLRVNNL